MKGMKQTDVAIVGVSCHFPGADDYTSYWQNLVAKKNSIQEIPAARWDIDTHYSSTKNSINKSVSKWCGLINDIKSFDNEFFNISPIEAQNMDPQQRLLLQESWHCIEDSAIPLSTLQQAKTSVFVGAMTSDYLQALNKCNDATSRFSILGNDHCILANRISHQLNLSGESISINAASASSLVAIHKAKSALVHGECDYAIAAGVNLNIDPFKYIVFSQAGMLSPDGQCKSFSDDANGYVPGDGVAALLLQPLEQAIKNHQHIYGVIKGSAINHIGSGKDITAPCADAQAAVIRDALKDAEKDISEVGYIEAHGSGTPLGDPIELAALSRVFKDAKSEVIIGTVKPNIGHLEAAAGIAGVIKALQVLKHQFIPANLNLNHINPVINLKQTKLKLASGDFLNTHRKPCVGVSSFGFGGVSCHLVLEKYVPHHSDKKTVAAKNTPVHFVLSAKSKRSLDQNINHWHHHLESPQSIQDDFHDICASVATGRVAFPVRIGFVVASKEHLISQLKHCKVVGQQTPKATSFVFADCRGSALKSHVPLVNQHYQHLLQCVESSAQYDAQKALNVFRRTDFKNTLLSVAVFNALNELLITPSLIEQLDQNTWAALLGAECVNLDDYLAVVLHNKKPADVMFYHPRYPLKISPKSQTIYPQYFNDIFLQQLFKEVETKQRQYQNIIDQSLNLSENKVFVDLISLWNEPNNSAHDIFAGLQKFSEILLSDVPKATYLLVAANVALNRFYQKWQLENGLCQNLYHITLVGDLIEHQVISEADLNQIIQKSSSFNSDRFKAINARHWRTINQLVDGDKKPLHNAPISDKSSLVAAINQSGNILSKNPKNIPRVAIGQLSDKLKFGIDMEVYDFEQWQKTLLALWLKGNEVNWSQLYPADSFQKVQLPCYVFEKVDFWTSAKLPESTEHLFSVQKESEPTATDIQKTKVLKSVTEKTSNKAGQKIPQIIINLLANLLALNPNKIDLNKNLEAFGLDSMAYTALCDQINQHFKVSLTPACFYGFKNVQQIIAAVAQQTPESDVVYKAQNTSQRPNPISVDSSPEGKTETSTKENANPDEDIAIVGYAGSMPQSDSLDQFWSNLMEGVDGISQIPEKRWRWQDSYSKDIKAINKSNSKWGGFITDIDCFDAAFFGISPQEAKLMDPQQRILLQTVWHALEQGGHQPAALAGTDTGVFIGASTSDYEELIRAHELAAHASTGMNRSIIANRISFVLDLQGPSEVVDTACSSSLVAIHKAVQAIKTGACKVALAGGVNALITPTHYISYGKAGMLSPDGRCKTFDQGANGYVRAEGVGVVVLKRLSQAIKDGDVIHAVIKATGTNHGGKASSLTAPNPKAQAQLIIDTYRKAGISSQSIDYIENHGTGTPLGDPIEVNGLNLAFETLAAEEANINQPHVCHLASVKSNIGHLEAAAGIAGTLKVLLALKHQYLPSSQRIETLNPFVKVNKKLFNILQENTPWPSQAKQKPRRAGISSFGFGGVNAHIVLEEYRPSDAILENAPQSRKETNHSGQAKQMILLSAKTKQTLAVYAENYLDFLTNTKDPFSLKQLAYTTQTGRNHENHRLVICAHSIEEVTAGLSAFMNHVNNEKYSFGTVEDDSSNSELENQIITYWQQGKTSKIAKLWVKGSRINWQLLYKNKTFQRMVLPTYPFVKKSHWLQPDSQQLVDKKTLTQAADTVKAGISWTSHQQLVSNQHYLATEHTVDGSTILPGVFSLVMLYNHLKSSGIEFCDVAFKDVMWQAPISCKDSDLCLTVISQSNKNQSRQFKIVGTTTSSNQEQTFTQATYVEEQTPFKADPIAGFKSFKSLPIDDYYKHLSQTGFAYGPNFRVVKQVLYKQQSYLAQLEVEKNSSDEEAFILDPRLLDGALQSCLLVLIEQGLLTVNDWSYLPMMMGKFQVLKPMSDVVYALIQAEPAHLGQKQTRSFDIQLLNSQKQLCVSIKQVMFKRFKLSQDSSHQNKTKTDPVYPQNKNNSTNQNMSIKQAVNYPKGNRTVNTQALHQKTSQYLTQQIAEIAALEVSDVNVKQSFKEYGIDSFLTLSIIRKLEDDFGDLRKTLLFEASNINELVDIFISEHPSTLMTLLGIEVKDEVKEPETESVDSHDDLINTQASNTHHDLADIFAPQSKAAVQPELVVNDDQEYNIIKDDCIDQYIDLKPIIQQLFAQYGGESIALSRKDIAPYIFLCEKQLGMFYFNIHKNILLAFRYVGPKSFFLEAMAELKLYADIEQLEMNVLSEVMHDDMQQLDLVANPFGVVQRLPDLSDFTLKGSQMRRLRYQVNKFEKSGQAKTTEYKVGSDVAKDDAVAQMIERWASNKSGVNPYIWHVKEDMETGCLGAEYRVFLTYLDQSLQNVVIVSRIESDNSYLLDTEFYSNEMAMGAMDFAIYEIIQKLQQEGCAAFSLGLTFGASFIESPHADPAVSLAFEKLAKEGIFEESGNYQFKNKFRCDNDGLYLYRTAGQSADNVIDVIMMIGNPNSVKPAKPIVPEGASVAIDPINKTTSQSTTSAQSTQKLVPSVKPVDSESRKTVNQGIDRKHVIQQAGYNPFNLERDAIEFDLATDSWSELEYPFIKARTQLLQDKSHNQQQSLEVAVTEIFGLPHVLPFAAGRVAESFFCSAWSKGKKYVIQNVLFPTCLYHQVNNDFIPVEVVDEAFHNRHSKHIFKGNMDIKGLQSQLDAHSGDVAFVWVELADNAAGGCSVSISNLKDIKACIGDIPLVIDATRIIENAYHIAQYEAEFIGHDIWRIVHEICTYADVINASLTKDFGVHCGGFIATRDADLCAQILDSISTNGSGLSRMDRQLITQALMDKDFILSSVKARMDAVLQLAQYLSDNGLDVVQPIGGHCVLIDPMVINELSSLEAPLPAFLSWLYQNTGIRAGIHSVGRQRNTVMNNLIRLAVPLGISQDQIKTIGERLVQLFHNNSHINDLTLTSKPPGLFGEMKASYSVKQQVHLRLNTEPEVINQVQTNHHTNHDTAQALHTAGSQSSEEDTSSSAKQTQEPHHLKAKQVDAIAVIGMSGRYPDAENLAQFWNNISNSKNSIKMGPDWASRFVDPSTKQHLGGFIDDVDKFDSLFFSISPREAQNMDPQERLVMEVSWEALEDAGYYPESLIETIGSKQVGVFVGAVWSYYELLGAENRQLGGGSNANSQHWGISNRVSSFMNFNGPSLTVDTACSSSLTAIHLACESLRHGECQVALAGGINLDLHPSKHHITEAAQFLSDEGLCRAFGQGGSGYVAGEGVGTLVLKPLHLAEQDGDHIYGVIKSTVINHGGRTAGYTVPSPNAQADLIAAAINKAHISAATIGYVEAHGTGTELGDPVEIQGASKAYRLDTDAKQYCSIGSVKTNIGHLEAAAGIAGATKLLLQLQHKQLVPSLHSKVLNQHIDFKNSPFYVQQDKSPWQAIEEAGKKLPRRAGLSSFGAGGTNVHIIFEEHTGYSANQPAVNHSVEPHLIVLSARKDQQLQQQASQLLAWLENSNNQDADISQVAHTLQVGRLPMAKRMAVMAKDKTTLINGLRDFLDNKSNQSVLCPDNSAKMALDLFDGAESQQIVKLLINNSSFHKLARLWVNGVDINWLQASAKSGRKIPLPTYPFAKESHWIEAVNSDKPQAGENSDVHQLHNHSNDLRKALHPLIDSNLSAGDPWQYGKKFDINQFVFRDHIVDGLSTLPGVAYMEMARAAAQDMAAHTTEVQVTTLKNLVWASPINSQGSNDIRIQLVNKGSVVDFEICTFDSADKKTVHSQGKAEMVTESKIQAASKNLNAIKQRCSGFQSKSECYALLATRKLNYGASLQSIEGFYYGSNEGLTVLKLPSSLRATFDDFQAHPSILDGAVQSIISLLEFTDTQTQPGVPYVPFVLSELVMYKPLVENCFAHLTLVEGDKQRDDIKKINIDIINESGEVLLQMKEFSFKAIVEQVKANKQMADPVFSTLNQADVLLYQPAWLPKELSAQNDFGQSDSNSAVVLFDHLINHQSNLKQALKNDQSKVVLVEPNKSFLKLENDHYQLCPSDADHVQKLIDSLMADGMKPHHFIQNLSDNDFKPQQSAIESDLNNGLYAVFTLSQVLLKNRKAIGSKDLGITYLYHCRENLTQPSFATISAFFRSIKHEGANLDVKSVCLSHRAEAKNQAINWPQLVQEMHQKTDVEVMYKNQQRFCRQSIQVNVSDHKTTHQSMELSKENGVYLITGGVGGLGLLFAEALLKKPGVQLILTGRSTADDGIQAKLKQLNGSVAYLSCDLTDAAQVSQLIKTVAEKFNSLDGVIHAAGIIKDGFLWNKELPQFKTVLAAKIIGTQNLDQATKDIKLDYFMLCSSIASTIGNMGQSDYAAGNRFMDDFAALRSQWQQAGTRHGKSIAINWPLWKSGGMQVNEQAEQWMFENWGMKPLTTAVGLAAFKFAVTTDHPVLGLVQGDTQKIQQTLSIKANNVSSIDQTNAHSEDLKAETAAARVNNDNEFSTQSVNLEPQDIVDQLQLDLTDMVVSLLKIKATDIAFSDNMSTYGFDSVTFTEFANLINNELEIDVTPLIFFEQETLDELTTYLLEDFGDDLNNHYARSSQNSQQSSNDTKIQHQAEPEINTEPEVTNKPDSSTDAFAEEQSNQQKTSNNPQNKHEDIAIIGMSGVMPQSADLGIFWQNLLDEKNLVTEIPKDRWDWQKFYGESDLGNSKTEIKWGGFIPEVDKFDADFFNISPLEAELTDPQQRLFLETVWHTVEDAGYQASSLSGTNTGVFVGIGTSDYHELLREQNSDFEAYSVMGWMHAVLANRISYFFNWTGPSEPIGTACSSSLVAIDRAVQAIRSGQCDQCIAGGISLILNPGLHIGLGKAQMLSADGQCKTFDHRANGYVRSEGVGALLLKPLSQAKADGDQIYAIIKGSAVNHGGHVNTFTTPNPKAQTAVMSMAYDDAGIDPATLTYIEAHGTGTALGDPIEIQGLLKAFKNKANLNNTVHNHKQYCALGSVKTNVGHLELAAGMAGMFKLILALKNKTIPASINFEKVNPYIKLNDSPFRLATHTQAWEQLLDINGDVIPRRAGISSFGFGGVNAHLILEEFKQQSVHSDQTELTAQPVIETAQIITLSTKYEAGLRAYAQQLLAFVETGVANQTLPLLTELAAGLQQGREAMPKRLALVVNGYPDLIKKLNDYCDHQSVNDVFHNVGSQTALTDVKAHDVETMISENNVLGLAESWVALAEIDWQRVNPRSSKISLPKYPFQKNRYWLLDPSYTGADDSEGAVETVNQFAQQESDGFESEPILKNVVNNLPLSVPGIKAELFNQTDAMYQFKIWIDANCGLITDHNIAGMEILPAATYLELLNQAVFHIKGSRAMRFNDVQWLGTLPNNNKQTELMLHLKINGTAYDFAFYAANEGLSSTQLCVGSVSTQEQARNFKSQPFDFNALQQNTLNQQDTYQWFKTQGFTYGNSLAAIKTLKTGAQESFTHLTLPHHLVGQINTNGLPTVMIDGALQSMLGVLLFDHKEPEIKVPVSVAAIDWIKPLTTDCYIHVVAKKNTNHSTSIGQTMFDINLYDQDKALALVFSGLTIRPLKASSHISKQKTESKSSINNEPKHQLKHHTVNFLAQMIADETKRDLAAIEPDSHFDGFGIDSFLAMRMTKKLEKVIGPVTKSVFFEHTTLNSLAEYLMATHQSGLTELFKHKIPQPSEQTNQNLSPHSSNLLGDESGDQLMTATCDYLSQMVADETKHERSSIQPDSPFEAFGIDSFLAMRMTKKLEKAIGSVDKTVFFEHATVADLAGYLSQQFTDQLIELFNLSEESQTKQVEHVDDKTTDNQAADSSIEYIIPGDEIKRRTINYLAKMVADETKRDITQVTADAGFESLGIDSFLAMRMTKKLEKAIGSVDKTAFFEHATVADLAAYLSKQFTAELRALFNLNTDSQAEQVNPVEDRNTNSKAAHSSKKHEKTDNEIKHRTLNYLAQMVADETKRDVNQVTADASFESLGIDSFLAMRVTKKLEKAIGPISKTAFFEHQNIMAFTDFLLKNHSSSLHQLLAVKTEPAGDPIKNISAAVDIQQPSYSIINEDELENQPHLQKIIGGLNKKYGKENKALARNAIAPIIFLSSSQQSLFNFNQHDGVALAFTYVGSETDLPALADEFIDYCNEHGLQGNMLLERELESTENRPYSSNAFGVMQRLTDIDSVTLKGSKMRRLRYQISKFKSAGTCTFTEYSIGSDSVTDQSITSMIDSWADTKKMVNPYIWTVKDQIAEGNLPKQHRVFLTHINEQLQNVIVITQLASENGYLMDLEFYGEDMPLGGLEYGIWYILQQLKSEGHQIFSMGATFGVISEQNSLADAKVYSILESLQQQGAFNGEGNLQFKNKFRPNNSTLFLCRPLNDDPEKVVDVIMMIANPFSQKSTAVAVK